MNPRTTLVLVVLVVLLGGWLWLRKDESPIPDDPTQPLADVTFSSVSRVELALTTQELVALERADDAWRLVEPVKDLADQELVRELFNVLSQNPRFRTDPSPSKEALASLGLEPPRARVSLIGADKPYHLRIGDRDATGHYAYVYIDGDGALYRTGANVLNIVSKPRQEWQERRFVDRDGALVRRMTLTRPGKPRVVLEKSGVDWLLSEPIAFPAGSAATGLLGVMQARIQDFVKDAPTDEELAKRGLLDTATTLEYDFGGRVLTLRFGFGKDDDPRGLLRFAIDSERDYLVVVSTPALQWLDKDAKDFRDPDLCKVSNTTARSARLRRGTDEVFEIGYDRTERRFKIAAPFVYPAADDRTSALYSWFQDVNALHARDFTDVSELPEGIADPLAALGLAPPRATVEIERAEGQVNRAIVLEFGDPSGDGTVPVRRRDRFEGVLYDVPQDQVDRVIGADPRQFLDPRLFDPELLNYKTVSLQAGERSATIRRDDVQAAPVWRDPRHPDANTAPFQEFVSTLPGREILRFLPRDPEEEDGLDAPAAVLTVGFTDTQTPPLVVTLGARSADGVTVHCSASRFPRRTVFEMDARMLDDLLAVLR